MQGILDGCPQVILCAIDNIYASLNGTFSSKHHSPNALSTQSYLKSYMHNEKLRVTVIIKEMNSKADAMQHNI